MLSHTLVQPKKLCKYWDILHPLLKDRVLADPNPDSSGKKRKYGKRSGENEDENEDDADLTDHLQGISSPHHQGVSQDRAGYGDGGSMMGDGIAAVENDILEMAGSNLLNEEMARQLIGSGFSTTRTENVLSTSLVDTTLHATPTTSLAQELSSPQSLLLPSPKRTRLATQAGDSNLADPSTESSIHARLLQQMQQSAELHQQQHQQQQQLQPYDQQGTHHHHAPQVHGSTSSGPTPQKQTLPHHPISDNLSVDDALLDHRFRVLITYEDAMEQRRIASEEMRRALEERQQAAEERRRALMDRESAILESQRHIEQRILELQREKVEHEKKLITLKTMLEIGYSKEDILQELKNML
jgi:hypothetical protein